MIYFNGERHGNAAVTIVGSGVTTSSISYIELLVTEWSGDNGRYSQVVNVPTATPNSKVDLNPSVEQLDIFRTKDLTFVTENDNGVITVYCIGQKPSDDYTMQITITEVGANG